MATPRIVIPAPLADRMRTVHGAAGAAWVKSAPGRIAALALDWAFAPREPFPGLTYAFVAPVTLGDGRDAVLKAQPPHMESRSELVALAAWDGEGAVRLLRADPDAGIALLERLRPGQRLADASATDDDESIRIGARLMPRLWRQPPGDPALITAERWGSGFEDYLSRPATPDRDTRELVERAAATWRHLAATTERSRLLHGDFHHDNILSAGREPWLAIDPKGVVGDPHLEPAMLLLNPRERLRRETDLGPFFAHRLDILAAVTGLDRGRAAAWGFAKAALSYTWDATDAAEPSAAEWLRQARALEAILPAGLRSLPSS